MTGPKATAEQRDAPRARRATAADVPALVDLRAEMYEAMGVDPSDEAWREPAGRWFVARLDDPDFGIFVVEENGVVAACGMGAIRDAAPSPSSPRGRDVLISNVCTRAEYRGRGLGTAVFEAVLDWARRTGVAVAELAATDGGIRIYEKAGFEVSAWPAMRARLGGSPPASSS